MGKTFQKNLQKLYKMSRKKKFEITKRCSNVQINSPTDVKSLSNMSEKLFKSEKHLIILKIKVTQYLKITRNSESRIDIKNPIRCGKSVFRKSMKCKCWDLKNCHHWNHEYPNIKTKLRGNFEFCVWSPVPDPHQFDGSRIFIST